MLMRAVQRVASMKVSPARKLWLKALSYAKAAAALIALHNRLRSAAIDGEDHLPPIKRMSLRECTSLREGSVVKRGRESSRDGSVSPSIRIKRISLTDSKRTSVADSAAEEADDEVD